MTEPVLQPPGRMCDARIFLYQIRAFSAERPAIFIPLRDANTIAEFAKMLVSVASKNLRWRASSNA